MSSLISPSICSFNVFVSVPHIHKGAISRDFHLIPRGGVSARGRPQNGIYSSKSVFFLRCCNDFSIWCVYVLVLTAMWCCWLSLLLCMVGDVPLCARACWCVEVSQASGSDYFLRRSLKRKIIIFRPQHREKDSHKY